MCVTHHLAMDKDFDKNFKIAARTEPMHPSQTNKNEQQYRRLDQDHSQWEGTKCDPRDRWIAKSNQAQLYSWKEFRIMWSRLRRKSQP